VEVVIDSCVMKVDRGLEFVALCNFHLIYKSTFLFLTYSYLPVCVCVVQAFFVVRAAYRNENEKVWRSLRSHVYAAHIAEKKTFILINHVS